MNDFSSKFSLDLGAANKEGLREFFGKRGSLELVLVNDLI